MVIHLSVAVDAHKYGKQFTATGQKPATIKAIFREHTSLRRSLPLHETSSVFVYVDDAKMTLLSALITGPAGTPYAHGCFHFDVMFPYVLMIGE